MTTPRTLTSVLGNSQRLDGGAMFGNAPRALWTRWCQPDAENRIALACRALLVRDRGRTILLETGIGAFFDPKMKERYGVVEDEHVLLKSLAEQGVSPEQIDIVVLSHLHFDHAGGMLQAFTEGRPPALAFPNAKVVVGKQAWQRAQAPHFRDRASFIPELIALLQEPLASGDQRLEIVEADDSKLLGKGFHFYRSSGHTPGMLHCLIDMPEGPVVFAADLIPGTPWVHLPITMGYDRFPEQLIDEKRELLESLVLNDGRIFYTHDFHCAISKVERDERGRYRATDTLSTICELQR